jgi:hypothetical protein
MHATPLLDSLLKSSPKKRKFTVGMMTVPASTYICKQMFSVLNCRKNKFYSELTDEHLHQQLRIATANLKPNIDKFSEDFILQTLH